VRSTTVREAAFAVLREHDLLPLFANPGSTEVPLLVDLPPDLPFVLGLHEASVVGMATGWALGRTAVGLAILHTTAGLGNAVGALATARANRAPLVVLVGQQDRRHLAHEPFLAGRLRDLAGSYPVWTTEPARPQDVPGALARAAHEAQTRRGPALVIVPMDDWLADADESREAAAPTRVRRGGAVEAAELDELRRLLATARAPALVAGAGVDDDAGWAALVALAERLRAPVWQESFGARAGFPQDHPLFAGHLPADRRRLRAVLAAFDVVLCVGTAAFRQYPYDDGPLAPAGVKVAVVSDDPDEVHRSAASIALLAPPAAVCAGLAQALEQRDGDLPPRHRPPPAPQPPADGQLLAGHVLTALGERLAPDAIVVEETPSSRPELQARILARNPLGFVSAAMGGLGFGIPAATGFALACPERPVVAVVGDGSALYSIQALWSAVEYGAGALFVVLNNGGYAVMDRLAEQQGGRGPWPQFGHLDVGAVAAGFGCSVRRVAAHAELLEVFDETVPELGARREPLLLDIAVAPDAEFLP